MQITFFEGVRKSLALTPILFLAACGGGGGGSSVDLVSCPGGLGMTMGNTIAVSCSATEGTTLDSVVWAVTDKPSTSTLTALDSEIAPLFTPDKNGVYDLTVTAMSGTDQETQTVSVTVNNTAPTVECDENQTAALNETVALACDVSDPGEVSPAFTYAWEILESPSADVLSSIDAAESGLVPTVAGTYKIQLTVSDGELSDSATINLVVAGDPLKILPIGDSITQANTNTNSYRYELFKLLIDNGYLPGANFDFIGNQQYNEEFPADANDPVSVAIAVQNQKNQTWPAHSGYAFDQDHAGYWGKTTGEVNNFILGYNAPDNDPDIALIHLGSNDVRLGYSDADTITNLQTIIGKLKGFNPDVKIFVAIIIPSTNWDVTDFNNALRASGIDSDPNVTLVDQETGYDVANNYDGNHPNPTGEQAIAEKWFDAILADL